MTMGSVWRPWDEIPDSGMRCTDPAVLRAAAGIAAAAIRRKDAAARTEENEDE